MSKKPVKPAANDTSKPEVNLGLPRTTGHSGRQLESGQPAPGGPGRGSSMQGKKQDAKGGPQGANQGGASRGGSRIEPSHGRDNPAHHTGKGAPKGK